MVYEKVKFVEGENFITVEDTAALTEAEMRAFISRFTNDERMNEVDHLSILLDESFSADIEKELQAHGFVLHDESVFVRRDLTTLPEVNDRFELRSLLDVSTSTFQSVWERSMQGSSNAPSYLQMDEQMRSVEKELGPTYVDTCNIAYEGDKAIGVVLPHIEPGTEDEGRFFFFGLLPDERGRKKAAPLYWQGLKALKEDFGATYSIGATSVNNKAMQQVFATCGCEVTHRVKVYKKRKGS
ncbi:GNAT family N-acetyltransferase [Halobacillus litoralis]|uniref:GNAT family N-acetyltransferase n=1 Tax=Halobacillus litoralis TaxID=45668 RepID=UPI001CD487E5|nr:GNAT family N-acetyltransferase [Halobacillus litoralis]MCA0971208.1 GNAT family N-acetyltransferase [Halobacillus litoralis]